jgi:hypothetical protein
VIERLLLATLLVALVCAIGVAVRAFVGARSSRLASAASVAPATGDAIRLMLFSTPRCGDCQTQARIVDAERDNLGRPVEITHHDVLTEGDFARGFGIVTVPALVVAAPDGRIAGVRHGLVEPDRLRSLIAMAG